MWCRKPCLVVFASFAIGGPAVGAHAAEPPGPDAVLEGLVEEALTQNAALRAVRQAEVAARTVPTQAGSRPGPMIGLLYENDGVGPSLGREPMTRLGVSAGQEFPWPGKLAGRRRVAETEAAMAALDVDRARLSLIASVKRAYYALVLSRGLGGLALRHRDVWREIQESARARYASAAGPLQDLLRAQVEGTRLQALHAQHHAEARARLAQLNALLGRAMETPLETPDSPPTVEESRSLAEIVGWSEERSPELRAAILAVERDERALGVARLEGKPDVTLQAGYMLRGGLPLMWQAGGSVALPSRARARSAVAEAEARLAASRVRVVDVRVRLRAAVEQRMALLDAAEQIAATYRDGLLPQSDLAVRSALARYAAGEGPQAAALEATAAAIEDQIDYVRLLATRVSEHARLEEASLDDPVGIDSLLAHGRGGGSGMGSTPSAGEGMTSRKSNPGMQAR